MKKLFFICVIIVVLTIGCKASQRTPDIKKLRDSLALLIQQGTLKKDTVLLQRAFSLSDTLLRLDTAKSNKRFCYYHRAIILNSLGHTEEAEANTELTMQTFPKNSPEYLLFMAKKNYKLHQEDSVDFYCAKVLSICSHMQKEHSNGNKFLYIIAALYMSQGVDVARKYLTEKLREHPDNQLLLYIKDDWENFTEDLQPSVEGGAHYNNHKTDI